MIGLLDLDGRVALDVAQSSVLQFCQRGVRMKNFLKKSGKKR
jgi:protein tyrosine phosphatase (PTP) superfamily phosphohydrolase (DUF442 family)